MPVFVLRQLTTKLLGLGQAEASDMREVAALTFPASQNECDV